MILSINQNLLKLLIIAVAIAAPSRRAFGDDNSEWESSLLGRDTFWGTATNGVKPALHIEPDFVTNTLIRCTPILKSSHTNILVLYLPPLDNRFTIELTDSDGRSVPKTQKCEALNPFLTKPFGLNIGYNFPARYRRMPPLHPDDSEMLGGFDFILQDYFVITNSGAYNLTFQMRVIWFPPEWKGTTKTTNVPTILLPPIKAQIEIHKK